MWVRRWWYNRWPLSAEDSCPVSGWRHVWPMKEGHINCLSCGKHIYRRPPPPGYGIEC